MSRLFLLMLPIALTACAAPPAQPARPVQPEGGGAPMAFAVPMDPGSISCASLTNPSALAVAVDWSLGQARAGVISGARATPPEPSQISAALQSYCQSNPAASLRAATRQLAI